MSIVPTTFDLRGSSTRHTLRPPLAVGTGLTNTGAGGAAAQVILPANATHPNVLSQIFASLSVAAAAAVTVIVLDDTTEIFRWQIPAAVVTCPVFTFDPPLAGTINKTMTVTISAPGGSVVASLTLNAYLLK